MSRSVKDVLVRYGAVKIAIFGSEARGEAGPDSDVDILVEFDKKKKLSLFDLAAAQSELEREIGRKVDLVTKVNKFVQAYIRNDLIQIL